MPEIFLMRHFEPKPECKEIPVNVDQEYLKRLRGYFAGVGVHKIYASPIRRTLCTAQLLFTRNKIVIDRNLRIKGKHESLSCFRLRVNKTFRKMAEERTAVIISHNNTLNQILALYYKVPYRKVKIIFPFGEPLMLKIRKTGSIYFCKRVVL